MEPIIVNDNDLDIINQMNKHSSDFDMSFFLRGVIDKSGGLGVFYKLIDDKQLFGEIIYNTMLQDDGFAMEILLAAATYLNKKYNNIELLEILIPIIKQIKTNPNTI